MLFIKILFREIVNKLHYIYGENMDIVHSLCNKRPSLYYLLQLNYSGFNSGSVLGEQLDLHTSVVEIHARLLRKSVMEYIRV